MKRLTILLISLALILCALILRISAARTFKPGVALPRSPPPRRADALLAAAIEHAQQRRWLESVEILDASMRAGADSATVHRTLGRCLGELGWVTDTIEEYRKAIEREPGYFNTYISLATAYRSIGRRADALKTLERAEEVMRTGPYKEAPARYARPAAAMLEDLAEAYARVGEFPKSVEWAAQAQTADPTRWQGFVLAAKSLFVLHQPDRAIPLLQKASSIAPADPDIHYTLALALRARPSAPHNEAARQHLLAALRLDPQHAPAIYQLGLLCMERREWATALTAFQHAYALNYEPGTVLWQAAQACKAKRDTAQATFLMGQYSEYVGQLPAALRYFRAFGAAKGHEDSSRVFIARVLTKSGDYTAAIETLRKAVPRDRQPAEIHRQMAAVYDKMHLITKQVDELKEAGRLDPKGAHHDLYQLGKISLDVGKYDEAEQYLRRAIALQPQASQYHYSLGQTYLLRAETGDRLSLAIQELEDAERLAPDEVYIHDFLSSAYIKVGRWTDAAIALHRSANASAQNAGLYFRLNQVYRRLGSEGEAKRAQMYYQRLRREEVERDLLSRRVKANAGDPATHVAMGDLYLQEQMYAGARREYEKALDLKPDNPSVHERLTTVYGELSQPEGQWRHLQQFRKLTGRPKQGGAA